MTKVNDRSTRWTRSWKARGWREGDKVNLLSETEWKRNWWGSLSLTKTLRLCVSATLVFCLSICLFVCLSVCLYFCQPVSIRLSFFLFSCRSTSYLRQQVPRSPSVPLPILVCIYPLLIQSLCRCVWACLSISLFISNTCVNKYNALERKMRKKQACNIPADFPIIDQVLIYCLELFLSESGLNKLNTDPMFPAAPSLKIRSSVSLSTCPSARDTDQKRQKHESPSSVMIQGVAVSENLQWLRHILRLTMLAFLYHFSPLQRTMGRNQTV